MRPGKNSKVGRAGDVARLRVRDLRVGRGEAVVAGPFDWGLDAGEALVVTGPNGVGKSTLLRTLAGLIVPLSGVVEVTGMVDRAGEAVRSLAVVAHYCGHLNAMKTGLTVSENLRFWRAFLGPTPVGAGFDAPSMPPEVALDALGIGGLGAIPFGYLSAGQKRRASLARLLVAPRRIWLLDEPTSALDLKAQDTFAGLIETHLAGGGMVVAATHQPLGLSTARTLAIEAADAAEPGGGPTIAIDEDELAAAEGWL